MAYKKQWNDCKKRSRLYWFSVMVFVPALAIGLPLAVTRHSPTRFYIYLFALGITGFAICVVGHYRSYWKCPRRQKSFFRNLQIGDTNLYDIRASLCELRFAEMGGIRTNRKLKY